LTTSEQDQQGSLSAYSGPNKIKAEHSKTIKHTCDYVGNIKT